MAIHSLNCPNKKKLNLIQLLSTIQCCGPNNFQADTIPSNKFVISFLYQYYIPLLTCFLRFQSSPTPISFLIFLIIAESNISHKIISQISIFAWKNQLCCTYHISGYRLLSSRKSAKTGYSAIRYRLI